MTQVILLASRLGTLDLNYFKNKIKNKNLHKMLFGSGPSSLKELNVFFDNLDVETLTHDERLAIECFSRKMDILPSNESENGYEALNYIDEKVKETLEALRENLDEETKNFYE